MSYDLAVWHTERRLSDHDAGALYIQLCDSNVDGVSDHPAIQAFYDELVVLHPEIDDIPEDRIDDHDYCPWSIAFDRSPGHIIMSCVWPKAEYCCSLILGMAQKYGLATFDPQSGKIVYPDDACDVNVRRKPWWKIW